MRFFSMRAVFFAMVVMMLTSASYGQLRISVTFGPPALPVYEQPICPGDGYIWTPGYWAWSQDDGDYYWVPGTWVLAPEVGYLWTPPYWAWVDGGFAFYDGYWGPQIGFYGGINYGFGYFGTGFVGGRWDGGHFFYNQAVTNVNVTVIHNVYRTTVNTTIVNRVSYNGGNGGVVARPTAQEEAAARERHIPPAEAQVRQVQAARTNREFLASANHGKPPVAATARPGEFSGHDAVPAREAGAPYNPPANRGAAPAHGEPAENGGRPATAVHPRDLPPIEHSPAPNTGDANLDKKYQAQQDKLAQKQNQERQKLEQRQEKEDQQMAKQNANDARKQQTEQRHQQQTQQMQQRHTQQQQQMQQRQAPAPHPEGGGKPR
jgi:hypothetical protein